MKIKHNWNKHKLITYSRYWHYLYVLRYRQLQTKDAAKTRIVCVFPGIYDDYVL